MRTEEDNNNTWLKFLLSEPTSIPKKNEEYNKVWNVLNPNKIMKTVISYLEKQNGETLSKYGLKKYIDSLSRTSTMVSVISNEDDNEIQIDEDRLNIAINKYIGSGVQRITYIYISIILILFLIIILVLILDNIFLDSKRFKN